MHNIFIIIKKSLLYGIRDKKNMAMMILFPIVLILVLGTALASQDGPSIDLKDTTVFYSINGNSEASKSFQDFIDDLNKSKKFDTKFVKTKNDSYAKDMVKKDRLYIGYIKVEDSSEIKVYKKDDTRGSLIQSLVSSYSDRYNALSEIAKKNPQSLMKIASDASDDFTRITSVNKKKAPSSIGYYAIAMITNIIMYGASYGLYGIAGERIGKTEGRVFCSPIKKYQYFIGKIFGNIIVVALQEIIVILASKYIIKADFGNNILAVFLIFLSQIVFSVTLGVTLGFMSNTSASNGILNMAIPFVSFLGGCYFPIDSIPVLNSISVISPLRWVNKSIFGIIYSSDYSKMMPTIAINLVLAGILITISSVIVRKEAK